jgi:hypothetical protein
VAAALVNFGVNAMNFRSLLVALPVSLVAAAGLAWVAVPANAANGGSQLAQAQTAPAPQPAPPSAGANTDRPMRQFSPQKACYDRNARRIGQRAYLKARLDLKPEQMALWSAFEKASDEVSAKQKARCAALPTEQPQAPPSLTDRVNRQEERMKMRLEAIQAVKPSLGALYASLTPEQKEIVDRGGERRMGRHGHRHHHR